ncbi:amidohydrolase [Deltaproteobacteria bacterium]|nr:amidohydrolase [Deltaproteobacteria bacterium]
MEAQKGRRRFLKYLFSLSAFSAGSIFSLKGTTGFKSGIQGPFTTNPSEAKAVTSGGSQGQSRSSSLKIDMFTHIVPKNYADAVQDIASVMPRLSDLDDRFRKMDELGETLQVSTLGQPPIEDIADPIKAVDLAKIANDGMAELLAKYPDRFAGCTAALPMNNPDAAIKEIDRAINDLNLTGIQVFTSINGKGLDSPEFIPLYEKMAQYDRPIWIHPVSNPNHPYYPAEKDSTNDFDNSIGWPHTTSMAMMRIASTGILERFPNLKFITHHSGGTVPYLANRIGGGPDRYENLTKPITESLRLFYYDTAVQGNTPNLMCANAFCGIDHQLYGTDFPMADKALIERVIHSIDEMDITETEKRKIYADNARRILHLKI